MQAFLVHKIHVSYDAYKDATFHKHCQLISLSQFSDKCSRCFYNKDLQKRLLVLVLDQYIMEKNLTTLHSEFRVPLLCFKTV